MKDYIWTPPELLSSNEEFTVGGKSTGLTVRDYWSFQFSNIWDIQEEVAEFIVAKALGLEVPHNKNGWTLWDINYRGKRIEIKESAYFHSWRNDGKTTESRYFGINKSYAEYKDNTSEYARQNDIYVFCLNTGKTKEESNPLNLDHWEFYVIRTAVINRVCGDNKHITLGRLQTLTKKAECACVSYDKLKMAVDAAIDEDLKTD